MLCLGHKCGHLSGSLVLGIEGPADDQPPDLWSSGPNFVQLGVPQEPPGRVVVDVPIASKNLKKYEQINFKIKVFFKFVGIRWPFYIQHTVSLIIFDVKAYSNGHVIHQFLSASVWNTGETGDIHKPIIPWLFIVTRWSKQYGFNLRWISQWT